MIEFNGAGTEGVCCLRKTYIFISEGQILFHGSASISRGACIRITGGEVIVGNNFYANRNLTLFCKKRIVFGNDVLLGWDVTIRDCDGHKILLDGCTINSSKPIEIGNHVWIGQNVSILKGSFISDDTVVGMNSCVTKQFLLPNVIIGGYPAKYLKSNTTWQG